LECELCTLCRGGEGRGGEGRGVLGLNKNTVEKRERRFLTFMKMILSTTNLNAMKVHKAAAIDKGESIPG